MEYLCAEVSKLGRLFKADRLHAKRVWADTGVRRHDAVDVGPYLDRAGMQAASARSWSVTLDIAETTTTG
jgi:hypothetical protein